MQLELFLKNRALTLLAALRQRLSHEPQRQTWNRTRLRENPLARVSTLSFGQTSRWRYHERVRQVDDQGARGSL